MTQPSEPRTVAGRTWLANREKYELWHPIDGRRAETVEAILAIEAEAFSAGRSDTWSPEHDYAATPAPVASPAPDVARCHRIGCGHILGSHDAAHAPAACRVRGCRCGEFRRVAPDPVASPAEAVNAAIRSLRDLSPDAEWIEKFYAALEAMAWLATGHELVAEGTPPHVVMARFIDDLAWRTVASPPEAVELLRELVALLDESGYPEWVDLDAAEDTLAEARRFLEGPVASATGRGAAGAGADRL